jgi:hypothetical protein
MGEMITAQLTGLDRRIEALMAAVGADFKPRVLECFVSVCSELSTEKGIEWRVVEAGFLNRVRNGSHLIQVDKQTIAYLFFNQRGFILTAVKKLETSSYTAKENVKSTYNEEFEWSEFTGKLNDGDGQAARKTIMKTLKSIRGI